jgi:hypothetical protein
MVFSFVIMTIVFLKMTIFMKKIIFFFKKKKELHSMLYIASEFLFFIIFLNDYIKKKKCWTKIVLKNCLYHSSCIKKTHLFLFSCSQVSQLSIPVTSV